MNLYFISSYSDIVGSASIDCGNYTISIPSGFTLYESNNQRALIHNDNNGMNINFYNNLKDDNNYENKAEDLNNSSEFKILSKGNITIDNTQIDCIFYQRNSDHQNRSTFYFEKLNHDFRILITDFNYDSDKNETLYYVTEIVSSLRLNYKNINN